MNYSELVSTLEKWMETNEEMVGVVKIISAAIVANATIDDIPIWLILIGPAGGGKTTLINTFSKSQYTHTISTMTPASLLSGYEKSESLLTKLNKKTLLIRDFSTITELNADQRSMIFSLLRDAYDGEVSRATGRFTISFTGKFGVVGCSTPVIEHFKKMDALLGERFLHLRITTKKDKDNKVFKKLRNTINQKDEMMREIAEAGRQFLQETIEQIPQVLPTIPITDREYNILEEISTLAVKYRASVVRDTYTKEIVYPAEVQEEPQRIFKQLSILLKILKCVDVIGNRDSSISDPENFRLILKILFDSIPIQRLKVLKVIREIEEENKDGANLDCSVSTIARKIKVSVTYAQRLIEEMVYLGLITESTFEIVDKTIRQFVYP